MTEITHRPYCREHPRRDGVEVIDPIDSARFALFTPESVTPTTVDPGAFYFPVDVAAAVETGAVTVPKFGSVVVRTGDGEMVADTAGGDDRSLPPGAYDLEVTTAPMKLYLAVESGVEVTRREDGVEVAFDGTTTLRVGARSFHEKPAGTITVTDDPEDAMRAVSLFASALKTTSPERTFPTLRGFPPLVERGERFDAPDALQRPVSGVRLVVPPEFEYVYPASTLAFFTAADVVAGDDPRLVAGETVYSLPAGDGFERAVHRVTKQVFTLDCVARTDGYYDVDLHERRALERRLDLSFADVYGRPLADRVAAYLDVPFERVEEHVPTWNLVTDVWPAAEHVETLPYLVNDLSLVRCPGRERARAEPTPEAVADFYRGDSRPRSASDAAFARGAGHRAGESRPGEVFQPAPADAVEQAWVGDGYPLGANKLTLPGLRRGVEWTPDEDHRIGVRVVCNDEQMREEDAVSEFYGVRDLLEFDVRVDYDLSTAALRDLLGEEIDFLHYVGHVDDRGFQCADGFLDASTLGDVGVRAFLLNACSSYDQGEALVERGSLGGVVTLTDVANCIATSLGRPMAKLLNSGFPLRSALSVAQDHVLTGGRYVTVGDGGVTLCQAEGGCPGVASVQRADDGQLRMSFRHYWNRTYGLGTHYADTFTSSDVRHVSTETPPVEISEADLAELLQMETFPIEAGGSLYWSDSISVENLDV